MKPHYTVSDPGLRNHDRLLIFAGVCFLIAFVLMVIWLFPAHAHADTTPTDAITLSNFTATPTSCGIGKVTKCYRNSAGLFGSVRWGNRIISKRLAVCWINMPVPVCAR